MNRTTTKLEPKALPFPEMSVVNVSDSKEDTLTALQLANYETAGLITEKNKSKAEKKKGPYIINVNIGEIYVPFFLRT